MPNDDGPDLELLEGGRDPDDTEQQPAAQWQGPPWPHPDNLLLKVVVDTAVTAYQRGEVSAEGAILHAAVHGWYEGYLDASED